MPRLGINFNKDQFLEHCRITKPPYECPHVSCGRVYRSLSGIQHHMSTFDHENPPATPNCFKSGRKKSLKRSSSPVATSENGSQIPYSTDMKTVEFELDGMMNVLNVYDKIQLISKTEFDAVNGEIPKESIPSEVECYSSAKSTPKNSKGRSVEKEKCMDVQRYTIEDKKTKFPEASFQILKHYYDSLSDFSLPTEYIKYADKKTDELDKELEYDMDEEDYAWLELMNKKRSLEKLQPVRMEDFELIMDRLEKESFFQAQTCGRDAGGNIDEDAVCCICLDGDCQNSNFILFCDMCNLAVHQECYGVPYIPEGQWLCRRCLQSPSRAVDCALCPNKGGAFKQTDDGRWAHVVCAMWIPEVCFANTVFLEPVDSIGNIPPARWKLTCYICKQRGVGACIQCNKVNCYTAFHVTCAQQAGLHMKIDAIRETTANGTSVTVRKAAYCDMHTPADSEAQPNLEEFEAKKNEAKASSREKMKKARKILAEKRAASPIVSVPIIPAQKIQTLAEAIDIQKKAQFIHRLLAFWTLKRQARNGVPLLRRLTSSHFRRNNAAYANRNRSPSFNDISPNKKKEEKPKWRREVKCWQQLRQDLERVRLLCELLRKREKVKRNLIEIKSEEMEMRLMPFRHLMMETVKMIQEKDVQQIFAEPVDLNEVPDYLDIVKEPIDLSTIYQKARDQKYTSIEQLVVDFDVMIDNCMNYNARDTHYYRSAVKLRQQVKSLFTQLRKSIDFDKESGLFCPREPKLVTETNSSKICKEVDDALATYHEYIPLEEQEKFLLNLIDKASSVHHHISRLKRIKNIKREMNVVRRKLPDKDGNNGSSAKSSGASLDTVEDNSNMDGSSLYGDNEKVNTDTKNEDIEATPVIFFNKTATSEETETEKKESVPCTNETTIQPTIRKRKPGRPPRTMQYDENNGLNKSGNETDSNEKKESSHGVNRRTSVLFTKKAGALSKTLTTEPSKETAESTPLEVHELVEEIKLPAKESFKVYREGRAMQNETDDTQSESASGFSFSDGSDNDSESDGLDSDSSTSSNGTHIHGIQNEQIPLEPLDLVWAKCRGYPWYPALIINPKMPKTGYFHNHEPIPVPPDEVLALGANYDYPMYLVLFFDQKRTWQWLPRNKLEPLGVDSLLDKSKLVESRKPAERKAVKKAYEKAIMHRCRVTGENTGLSEDSEKE